MKLKFSKIMLWFMAFGAWFAFVEIVCSVLYGVTHGATQAIFADMGTGALLVCPFGLAEMEFEYHVAWTEKVWVYCEVFVLNVLLYLILGSIVSTPARFFRRSPRPADPVS
jgi:hypothetical protein